MTAIAEATGLTLWRDHDEDVLGLPGIAMGEHPMPATDATGVVAGWYRDGVRRAALAAPVDLSGEQSALELVRAMVTLRELTGWGIVADWDVRLGRLGLWQRLCHLYPPRTLLDEPDPAAAAEALDGWRSTYYLCKCVYRHGPGFVQVRDRRSGSLQRFTIDDPAYLAAIDVLLDGAPVDAVPRHVLDDYVNEGLAGVAGDLAWWVPYRVHRWPWPSMIV
jgi:hypothetical protein